ncbi:MAG: aminotransferase class I/II-fold pyridoxal phosphate-dependent enzyme, partial [Acidimicrobiia bacterium]|nr:aminotransferase class I/II-fold pyridoxal phosphate-dependent enzyme [Acidimicrobiia bacterium]
EVPTDASTGFRATVDMLESARTAATKALIFVSPSNPTGAVYSRDEIRAIGRWAADHGIWVMTDEIYEHLVYGSAEFVSMPAEVPDLRDRCIIVNGVAKTYAMTGWRVGWLIGPSDVTKAATRLQSHSTSNVANVSQAAAEAAVRGGLEAVEQMRVAFDRRRNAMYSMLNDIPGVECIEPEGAFYAFPSFGELVGRSVKGETVTSTLQLADIVLEHAGVAFVPGEAFGAPGYARFSYALSDDDLAHGIERLAELLATAT